MNPAQPSSNQILLVTGPSRSGKSEWAEQLTQQVAAQFQQRVVYLATAQVNPADLEWQRRLQRHQQRRPTHWQTRHVPLALGEAIATVTAQHCLLVDSLGTWVANFLDQEEADWGLRVDHLLDTLQCSPANQILVAEETGWGVVPAYESGRRFRDRLGELTRQVGAIATEVYLVTGGYALNLRQLGTPLPRVMREDANGKSLQTTD